MVPLLTLIAVIDIDVIVSFCSGFGGGVGQLFVIHVVTRALKQNLTL